MASPRTTIRAAPAAQISLRAVALLSVLAAATAAVAAGFQRKRRQAGREAQAKTVVGCGVRVLLAIDIGSSSVRCSAYTVGSPPVLVPGCAVQIKHAVVKADGRADAEEVIDLVDTAVDQCFSELRARGVAHTVTTVGFACFGMNLVGIDADGKPCTPVFTYAANSSSSSNSNFSFNFNCDSSSCSSPTSTPTYCSGGRSSAATSACRPTDRSSAGHSAGCSAGTTTGGSAGCSASEEKDDVMKRLRVSLERTGEGGEGGLEETRRRTGAPIHMSYAPPQLLRWLQTTAAAAPVSTREVGTWDSPLKRRQRQRLRQQQQQQQQQPERQQPVKVKVWQTLPSLVAARWCRLASAPVSYSEASWMGLLDLKKLEWDAPTLSVLSEAGFDCSALPRLADVGGLRAGASGAALKRWPELDGASIRLGLGDGAAACIGSGCDETSGLIAVTVGTSAAARVVLHVEGGRDAAEIESAAEGTGAATVETATAAATTADATVSADALFRVPKGLWCYRVDRHRVVLGGALTDGGSAFEWLRSTLLLSPGGHMDAVMREVEGMPPNSHALVVLPFFSGERSPGYKDDATACILGLRRSTTRAQLVRAVLESVCLRLAAIVDLISGTGDGATGAEKKEAAGGGAAASAAALLRRRHEDAEVVTSGNAFAGSPFLRKILADALGRTVRASAEREETSLGVAILLSSLEGHQVAVPRTSGGRGSAGVQASAEAGVKVPPAGAAAAAAVHTPDEALRRAYKEAGLAQVRAYGAIFGAAGTGR